MNLYCLCGDLLEVGSLAKRSWMFGWLGQLPDGREMFMPFEQVGMGGDSTKSVSAQSTWWLDTAECGGMVGQRKLFNVNDCKEKYVEGLEFATH